MLYKGVWKNAILLYRGKGRINASFCIGESRKCHFIVQGVSKMHFLFRRVSKMSFCCIGGSRKCPFVQRGYQKCHFVVYGVSKMHLFNRGVSKIGKFSSHPSPLVNGIVLIQLYLLNVLFNIPYTQQITTQIYRILGLFFLKYRENQLLSLWLYSFYFLSKLEKFS